MHVASENGIITCQCDHLTNFGSLVVSVGNSTWYLSYYCDKQRSVIIVKVQYPKFHVTSANN